MLKAADLSVLSEQDMFVDAIRVIHHLFIKIGL